MSKINVKESKLNVFCVSALKKVGVHPKDAKIAAKILVTNDMRGTNSHGTIALRGYVKQILGGGMNLKAEIKIIREGPAWALIDGGAGLGMVTAYKAMKIAIIKAKNSGIGMVNVKNSMHFSAAGYYAMMCTKENMIGIAMSNADPTVAVTGSIRRVIGNNPFACAIPVAKESAICLDIAMSTVAGGKINLAEKAGKKIPEGWLLDRDGNPTTDPSEFAKGGALLPFGSYKGYGLAVIVESLAAVLSGAAVTRELNNWTTDLSKPCKTGHIFLAIDIDKIIPIKTFKNRMNDLISEIKSAPKAKGVNCIYLPGEIELKKEKKAKVCGIELEDGVINSLKKLADDLELEVEYSKVFAK
jgi:LDH2 family malate/lactate/ureidoglycolate dehydrogenase